MTAMLALPIISIRSKTGEQGAYEHASKPQNCRHNKFRSTIHLKPPNHENRQAAKGEIACCRHPTIHIGDTKKSVYLKTSPFR